MLAIFLWIFSVLFSVYMYFPATYCPYPMGIVASMLNSISPLFILGAGFWLGFKVGKVVLRKRIRKEMLQSLAFASFAVTVSLFLFWVSQGITILVKEAAFLRAIDQGKLLATSIEAKKLESGNYPLPEDINDKPNTDSDICSFPHFRYYKTDGHDFRISLNVSDHFLSQDYLIYDSRKKIDDSEETLIEKWDSWFLVSKKNN